ncbi:hypothetical protein Ct61P_06189 [Colletotrichum tofieldiae]|nr:hypothetical protein Ct61P_06189 [Colletotrichum tofieldiae]
MDQMEHRDERPGDTSIKAGPVHSSALAGQHAPHPELAKPQQQQQQTKSAAVAQERRQSEGREGDGWAWHGMTKAREQDRRALGVWVGHGCRSVGR